MNCKYCNAEIPENSAFCPNCGQSAEEKVQPLKKGKGKRKKVAAIVAAVAVAAVVLIGATAHAKIGNFVRKTFSAPESYYKYVETKNRNIGKKIFVNYYDMIRKNMVVSESSQSVTYKIEPGQSVKTMLTMTGLDCSGLDQLEMNVTANQKDHVLDGKSNVLLNGSDLLSMNLHMNYDTLEYYLQIPELSEQYLDYSSLMQDDEAGAAFGILADLNRYIPETSVVDKIITTYTDFMIQQETEVEKSNTTLEAGGVKMDCTDLNVTCNGGKMYEISEEFIKMLKDDEDIKNYLEGLDEKSYTSFVEQMEETQEALSKEKEAFVASDAKMQMHVYVDNRGMIVGRDIKMSTGESSFTITGLQPAEGENFGCHYAIAQDGVEYVSVEGKGTKTEGKTNAEYSVSVDETVIPESEVITSSKDMITVKVNDLDEEAWQKEGYVNGSISLSTKAIAPLAGYELQLVSKGNNESASQSVSILCAGDTMLTFSAVNQEAKEEVGSMKPAEDAKKCDVSDDEAMESYEKSLKLDDLCEKIKKLSGVDLKTFWIVNFQKFGALS